ncbi:MAG: helix-turn-helix domain-containing protein [Planctomycetia bacterium]|nr:helix-turn-helix domain-containing protein [Planctomycetia bacterium]
MPRRRTGAAELSRLFEAAARPVFLIDCDGRLAYLNAACAMWLGIDADAELDVCRYSQGDATNAAKSLAAGLCPPPEVFRGERVTATVARSAADRTVSQRRCEFIPLVLIDGVEDEQAVLGVVDSNELPTVEDPPSDDARELHAALQRTQHWLRGKYRPESLAGRSAGIRRVRRQVKLAAASRVPVLICGSAGSGRQHAARAIHFSQPEPLGVFIPLACATLGADAVLEHVSALALSAERDPSKTPTLLLRDVEALDIFAQDKLAARLSSGRAGGRWIATSLTPVDELVAAGTFHADLAALLTTLVIRMPAFAERAEDLPLVAQAMLEEINGRSARQLSGFTPEALDVLAAHPPRGGWDELAEWIRQAHKRSTGLFIDRAALPDRARFVAEAAAYRRPEEERIDLEQFLGEIELELIQRALTKAKGNKTKAAELLSMNRPRFYRRLVQLGLEEQGSDE